MGVMSLGLALNLLDSALVGGGGTFKANGDEVSPIPGYVVGGKVPTLALPATAKVSVYRIEQIAAWIDENPSRYYGSWRDGDGVIYLDAVDIVDSLTEAMALGISRGEKAIWDGYDGTEVSLGEGGEDER